MTHTYTSITTSDTTYIPVSLIRPIGTVEDKFTWVTIDPDYDTWVELLAREHWVDWYFGTGYTDDYTSKTNPSYSYTSKTKSDNTFSSKSTPSASYSSITK